MPKKQKLKLDELEVQSFVTTVNDKKNQLKGGLTVFKLTRLDECGSMIDACESAWCPQTALQLCRTFNCPTFYCK